MKVLSNDGVAVGIIKSEPGGRNTVTGQVVRRFAACIQSLFD